MQESNGTAIIAAIYVTLSLLGLLLLVYVVVRWTRGIGRLWARVAGVFGENTVTRLISFAVAALLFSSVVNDFIRALALFGVDMVYRIPKALVTGLPDEQCANAVQCIGNLKAAFLQEWGLVLSADSVWRLADLPYGRLVLLLAVWAGVAQLLGRARSLEGSGERASSGGLWLQTLYARLGPDTRSNVMLFTILGIGVYLSVASIAAIGELQEKEGASPQISVDTLGVALNRTLRPESAFVHAFPETASVVMPFLELDSSLARLTDSLARRRKAAAGDPTWSDTSSLGPFIGYAAASLKSHKELRQKLVELWTTFRQAARQQERNAKEQAVTKYAASNIQRKGVRAQAQHFSSMIEWFNLNSIQMASKLTSCRSGLVDMDGRWLDWSGWMSETLRRPGTASWLLDRRRDFDYRAYYEVDQVCRASWEASEPPDRPQLGFYLGPFGLVAGWLLQTESISLVLITGLFGFGLLGSAVSSFVRQHVQAGKGRLLVTDLPGVVIRGSSAAIVVFLAVQGGLAVFSEEAAKANPYVVLITCLIAAVFSEDVWNAARERLVERLRGKGVGGATGGAPTQVAAPPPSSGGVVQDGESHRATGKDR